MPYYTPLPAHPGTRSNRYLNIVDGQSTAVQRSLRRTGISGYEPTTVAAILALLEAQDDGFTMFDIGANVGLYSCLCSALFDPSRVVAFEPTPSTAAIARRIARANATIVDVEEIALGPETTTASLFLSAKSDASNSMVEGFKENVGTVDVEMLTLDDYVAKSGFRPDVVKIDAETYEPEILRGARGVLTDVKPALVVEVLNRKGHDHGEEMMEAMDGLGYLYYDISPYSSWTPRDTISGDETGEERDWLLTPTPLPDNFPERFDAWEVSIADCTKERNRNSLGNTVRDGLVAEVGKNPKANEIARKVRALIRSARK